MRKIYTIKRDALLSKLIDYKDKDIIKTITGIRRCGKSYLLFEIFYQYLIQQGIDKKHIIKINLESKKNENLRDGNQLYQYVEKQILDEKRYYIFIDEIQMVDGFMILFVLPLNQLIICFSFKIHISLLPCLFQSISS